MSDNPTEKKESPGNFPEKDEETDVSLEDSDILDCALGFFIDKIVNLKDRNPVTASFSHSVNGKENISFENAFSKREGIPITENDFFKNYESNTLFLNSLYPKITLYKTYYNMKNGRIISSTDIPFNLEATWSKDGVVRNKIGYDTRNIIQNILQKGGPGGVGISSFEWTSQGKNEGNLTLYKAKIKFVLQNISEMSVIRGRSENGIEISLLDMLYQHSSKNLSKDSVEKYNVEDSIIKAVIGWHTPDQYSKIKNYFQTTLRLSMYNHTFNFLDNGKVELTVEFTAGIEGLIYDKNKMNILINSEAAVIKKDIQILQSMIFIKNEQGIGQGFYDMFDQYDPIGETPELFEENGYKAKIPPGLSNNLKGLWDRRDWKDGLEKMWDHATDQWGSNWIESRFGEGSLLRRFERDFFVEKLQEKLREISRSFLISVLDKLIQEKAVYSIALDEKNFSILRAFVSVKELSPKRWKSLIDKIGPVEVETPPIEPGSFKDEFESSSTARYFGYSNILDTEDLKEVVTDSKDSLWTPIGQFLGMTEDIKRAPFIFLGDFLNVCLKQSLQERNEIDLFFSPFTYIKYDQKLAFSVGSTYESKNELGNIVKRINTDRLPRGVTSLANLPISFTALFKWFEERIVSREEKSMSLGAFLDNIFYHLLPMSIGSSQAPNAPKQNVVVNRKYFQTTNKITTNPTIDIEEFAKIYNNRESKKLEKKSNTYFNFYFGSIKQHSKLVLRGNKKEDEQRGIFHLYTNSSHGFVKNIKFKRADNPLLETTNLISAMDSAGNEYLRHPYNATITMFGNNFFEPGSLVYIVPNYIGTDLSNNIYFKIGLGGYYRIYEIKSNISTNGYETVLETIWESFPYKEK